MGTLLFLAALISVSPSPYEEVEAWQPQAETAPQAPAHDDGAQAIRALLPAIGGVGVGTVAAVGLMFGGGLLGPTVFVVGLVAGGLAFVAVPALAVWLFAADLPGWTPWLTAGSVLVGAGVGGMAGFLAGNAYIDSITPPDSDCRICGVDGFLAVFALPAVAAVVGGVGGAVASTTIGAFAE